MSRTFDTPEVIARPLIGRLLCYSGGDHKPPTVCDPAAGSGVLLECAARYLVEHRGIAPEVVAAECLFGWDVDPECVRLARERLVD